MVAREVHLHLDLRSPSDTLLAEADALLRQQFAEIEVKADDEAPYFSMVLVPGEGRRP